MEFEQFKEVKQQLTAHRMIKVTQLPRLEAVVEAYRTRGIKSLYNWQAECLTTPGLWSLHVSPLSNDPTHYIDVLLMYY